MSRNRRSLPSSECRKPGDDVSDSARPHGYSRPCGSAPAGRDEVMTAKGTWHVSTPCERVCASADAVWSDGLAAHRLCQCERDLPTECFELVGGHRVGLGEDGHDGHLPAQQSQQRQVCALAPVRSKEVEYYVNAAAAHVTCAAFAPYARLTNELAAEAGVDALEDRLMAAVDVAKSLPPRPPYHAWSKA
jgi:hypothetical protein